MRRHLATVFGMLALVCAFMWVTGFLGAVFIPFLPSQKSELIGAIGFGVASIGELGIYLFGFIADRIEKPEKKIIQKYGLR